MDKVIEKTLSLKKYLMEEPLVKEYLRVKNLLENNIELELLRSEIVKAKVTDENKYKELKTLYDNNPLVSNYYALKNELFDLLKEIENELGF